MTYFAALALAAFAFGLLAWKLFLEDFFQSPEVRKLRQMKRALESELRAKREVLKLRAELGQLQAQLDAQEEASMRRLEEQIASLGATPRDPAAEPAASDAQASGAGAARRSEEER